MNSFTNKEYTPREAMLFCYQFLASGPRLKLLQSIMDFNLAEILAKEGSLSEEDIIDILKLSPVRAKKWLSLLCMENMLIAKEKRNTLLYSLGPVLNLLFDNDGLWETYKQDTLSFRSVAFEKMVPILQGSPLKYDYHWPPQGDQAIYELESSMSQSAEFIFNLLQNTISMTAFKQILDIGGGDASLACLFSKLYPYQQWTVFNLPESAKLASIKVGSQHLDNRISVIAGDFLKIDAFPKGFDAILFSRVLFRCSEEVCKKLLTMVYEALPERGSLIICEAFKDEQTDFMLATEFKYLFWDDFDIAVIKDTAQYISLLEQIGFKDCTVSPVNELGVYRVLQAWK